MGDVGGGDGEVGGLARGHLRHRLLFLAGAQEVGYRRHLDVEAVQGQRVEVDGLPTRDVSGQYRVEGQAGNVDAVAREQGNGEVGVVGGLGYRLALKQRPKT